MCSNVTSPISPAAWRVTASPRPSGCGRSGRCVAGPIGRPGCATPTSRWIPKPTPWSAPSLDAADRRRTRQARHGPVVRPAARRRLRLTGHVTAGCGAASGAGQRAHRPRHPPPRPCIERSVCETSDGQPITPDAVRRLACDAELIPTVLESTGAVLDQGRARRVATVDQRRALRAMYRTCGHPDCSVRFADCEIHHVIEWIHQHGPTDLDNLLPLCNEHHHLVHDAGWHLTLHPDRTITLQRPDGTEAYHGSSIDVAPTGLTPTPDTPDDDADGGATTVRTRSMSCPSHFRPCFETSAKRALPTVPPSQREQRETGNETTAPGLLRRARSADTGGHRMRWR